MTSFRGQASWAKMTSPGGKANVTGVPPNQSDQKIEKNSPNIWKCSQNCSQYNCRKLFLNVKISNTKVFIWVKITHAQLRNSQISNFLPNLITLLPTKIVSKTE